MGIPISIFSVTKNYKVIPFFKQRLITLTLAVLITYTLTLVDNLEFYLLLVVFFSNTLIHLVLTFNLLVWMANSFMQMEYEFWDGVYQPIIWLRILISLVEWAITFIIKVWWVLSSNLFWLFDYWAFDENTTTVWQHLRIYLLPFTNKNSSLPIHYNVTFLYPFLIFNLSPI